MILARNCGNRQGNRPGHRRAGNAAYAPKILCCRNSKGVERTQNTTATTIQHVAVKSWLFAHRDAPGVPELSGALAWRSSHKRRRDELGCRRPSVSMRPDTTPGRAAGLHNLYCDIPRLPQPPPLATSNPTPLAYFAYWQAYRPEPHSTLPKISAAKNFGDLGV